MFCEEILSEALGDGAVDMLTVVLVVEDPIIVLIANRLVKLWVSSI